MSVIMEYLWSMTPAALLGLGGYWASRTTRLAGLKRHRLETTRGHELSLALFLMFLAGLLWLTVLPQRGYGELNLRPFLIFEQSRILAGQGNHRYFLINFWGNILMFVPIGFFPALLWRKRRWWLALLSGLGLSLLIELTQIPLDRGTDIDDLWLNTLGALAGYGVWAIARRLWPGRIEKCSVREVSPWT